MLDKRVSELKRKLKEVEKRRNRIVSARDGQMTVSLVGYTNAGKSTLMRSVTGADVLVADKLFATLETRTRRWAVPGCGEVLLSDTVGFVRDLPHHLVASFRSTLEEARNASLLLHVVDASNPEARLQIDTVNEVLDDIGCDLDSIQLVLNKCDAVDDRSLIDVLRVQNEGAVTISAATREGFDRLEKCVAERLGQGMVVAEVEGSISDGRLHGWLQEHGEVSESEYTDTRVTYQCRLPRRLAARPPEGDTTVRVDGVVISPVKPCLQDEA